MSGAYTSPVDFTTQIGQWLDIRSIDAGLRDIGRLLGTEINQLQGTSSALNFYAVSMELKFLKLNTELSRDLCLKRNREHYTHLDFEAYEMGGNYNH